MNFIEQYGWNETWQEKLGEAGIPGVIYGAGPRTVLESNAKRADERLELEDLRRATKVIDGQSVTGWFTGGPAPGETGPAVIAGHIDTVPVNDFRNLPLLSRTLRHRAPAPGGGGRIPQVRTPAPAVVADGSVPEPIDERVPAADR